MARYTPLSRAYIEDPYPILAQLRADEPVHWSADAGAWIVTRYADCVRILQDDDAFSSDPAHAGGDFGAEIAAKRAVAPTGSAAIMGNSDPPEHSRLRTMVNRGFTPRKIEGMREFIEDAVEALLAAAPEDEPFEVIGGLGEPLAVSTILAHLGFPPEDWSRVREWSMALMRARAEGDATAGVIAAAASAREQLLDYLAELAAAREAAGESDAPKDPLGALFDAMEADEIGPDELLTMLIHISLAGNGPTAMAVGNAAWVLSQHPEARDWLGTRPEAGQAAVEELLRFETPTHYVARFARKEMQLGGRKIRAGQQVHVMIASANRDPERFSDPDVLDLQRPDNRHLSFGYGIHFCLGAPLARIELEVATRALLEKFGPFRALGWERGGTPQVRGLRLLFIAGPKLREN